MNHFPCRFVLLPVFVFAALRGFAGENVLHSFSALTNGPYRNNGISLLNGTNLDGANPAAGLVWSGGILCGNTVNGGSNGVGTVFYITPDAGSFKAFRSFTNPPDAANPQGDLGVFGNSFFGAAFAGGTG